MDQRLKADIRKTREFIGLWTKFRDLYRNAARKDVLTADEESVFLDTKSLIEEKYAALRDSLGAYSLNGKDETMDALERVLSLDTMSAASDEVMRKTEESWRRSRACLDNMLKALEAGEEERAKRRALPTLLKRLFAKKITQFAAIVAAVFFIFYITAAVISFIWR